MRKIVANKRLLSGSRQLQTVLGFVLLALFLFSPHALLPLASAQSIDAGQIVQAPSTVCESDDGWLNVSNATGFNNHPEQTLTTQETAISTDAGAQLVCSGFDINQQHRKTPMLVIDLAVYDESLMQPATDLITIDDAAHKPQIIDAFPETTDPVAQTDVDIDSWVSVATSVDQGSTWQHLHILRSSDIESNSTVALALDENLNARLEDLSVKVETLTNTPQVSVDSISIAYEVGANEIELAHPPSKIVDATAENVVVSQDQDLELELKVKDENHGLWQGLAGVVGSESEPDDISVEVSIYQDGDVVEGTSADAQWHGKDFNGHNVWDVSVSAPDNMKPGKKTVVVTVTDSNSSQSVSQDFLWGVLALNTDKSVYRTGDVGDVHMTVLDDVGATICDSELTLEVYFEEALQQTLSTTTGELAPSETCVEYGNFITPDYQAAFQFGEPGTYQLNLSATTPAGTRTITDEVVVEDEPLVDVSRLGPTRIYPKVDYPMRFRITASENFTGTITETVPASFVVSPDDQSQRYDAAFEENGQQKLVWNVDVTAGQTISLGYRFDAPDVAPEFYLLGPMQLVSHAQEEFFSEQRSWQIASDAIGDIAIYREATGTDVMDGGGSTLTADYDTTVRQDAIYTINGTNNAVNLGDAGHYLVTHSASFDDAAGNGRREINTNIDINGTNSAYGRSTCYIRTANGSNECWQQGAAIIDVAANDDISIEHTRTDNQGAGNTITRRANESGLSLLKLNDNWDYARIQEATGGQSFAGQGFITVDWDTNDELDSGSFSRSGGDITLKQKGHYLITTNLKFNTTAAGTGTGARRAVESRLMLDGSPVEGTNVTAYIRGGNNDYDHALSYIGIIETLEPNQVLNVQSACTSLECSGVINTGGQTAVTIAKLPDNADFIRLHDSAGGQAVDGTNDPILWDTQDEVDSAAFSHNTVSNSSRINIDSADDYLFTGSFLSDRFGSANGGRQYPHWQWRLNGTTTVQHSGFGKFNRGNQGTSGDYSSGASGALLGSNLLATDYIELTNTDEAATTDALNTFQADKYAIQGVALTPLFATTSNTRQEHFRWRDDTAALNTASGFLAAEDSNAVGVIDTDQIYRLRIESANVRTANESAARTYELQFSEKTLAHCELQSTWVGISDSTSDAFHHQATSQFGEGDATTALLANSEGYTFVAGEGRNEADTSGSIGPLTAGPNQYTELEYSLVATSDSTAGATYCFRLYDTTAASALDSYGRYPELTLSSPQTRQLHFRWRDDSTALNTSGGFLAAEDSNAVGDAAKMNSFRLRLEVANTGSGTERAARTYELQFADRERFTACSNIAEGSWIGVGNASDAVDLIDVGNIADGQTATPGLLANTETYTFVDGHGHDTSDTTAAIGPLATSDYTELEYSIQVTDEAITGHSYCFRVYDTTAASALDSYDTYPELIVEGVSLDYGVRGEAGIVESAVDGGWLTINFENTYVTPVIIGQVTTEREDGPMIVEFRNVGATSAEMRACDTDGGSGSDCETHGAESVSYMVVDADTTDDYDGIEAGTTNRGGNAESNTTYPSETFGSAPYVFANVQDSANQPIETRINGVTTGLFGMSACDQTAIDTCSGVGPTRSMGWIAIEPGGTGLLPFNVEHNEGTITLGNSFVNSVTYASPFTELPAVFAEESTNDTANNVHIDRVLDVTTTGARVGFCEHEDDDNCGGDTNETVRYFAIEQGVFGRPSLDLTTYRWYDAQNANTPTTALNAENVAAFNISGPAGDIRLRVAVQVGVADLPISTDGFTLQYGVKTTTCSAIGTWTDVGATGSGAIWRGYNIGGVNDGDTITTSVLNAAANQLESIEEDNDSVVNPAAIDRGERGEWDWAVDENGAGATSDYCFRMVTDNNDLLAYSRYPEATPQGNTPPDDPTNLDQIKVSTSASLAVGEWVNETQVEFQADMTDTDNPDTLELCIEVQPLATAFTDIEASCGAGVTYSGTAVTGTLTITGLTDGTEYHWQARVRDSKGEYSNWVSFGANPEASTDFGIDSSAPTGGTVFDGATVGVDVDFNNGALNTLSANWSGVDATTSGLSEYEYAIGTTSGGTETLTWTSTGTTASFTNSSLVLNTETIYYVSVRTTDNAANVSTPITSDGILVSPEISFSSSTSPTGIDFGELDASNSYTATNAVTLTTSTNAYNGYVVRSYATSLLTNSNADTFPMFNGGSYLSPDQWLPADTGWGYTSNDTDIQGSDIFLPGGGTCAGGGAGPCYAPFTTGQPGDIVADHTATVSGTPITNEAFVITHRVTADPAQPNGIYNSIIVYNVSAIY